MNGRDRPRALVLAPMRGPGWDRLRGIADVVYDPATAHRPFRLYSAADLARRLAETGASILVTEADEVAGPVLDHPLRVIAATRGTPGNVDVAAATARGVPVLHAPGRNADAVAELTVGLLFAAARGVVAADREVRAGTAYAGGVLPYQRHRGWQLVGRTFGIVGLGAVGRAVRWRMEGLGMRVVACDPFAADATCGLDELLAVADVVSMHAALTAGTLGMIGEREFAAMREGALYLNTARAELHDAAALVAVLESGRLAGAGLDHFEGEWLDPAGPLAALPGAVLTPHIGGAAFDVEANHAAMVADGVERLLRGERPAHCVNPEVLDQDRGRSVPTAVPAAQVIAP
ncbi:NAD(P)-dependent oxidoreductase [Actinomadura xylanilytica]|uniref:NAD(P)-dependent oxidoreductase n=1 Tax=Actinomadura xylanilytica TaxID=887459 RepID=UPI00255AA6D5|nr:NAD(P)-dependent oxidoreductase [Actinomadura xylanilytica]MDL4776446.1 NAD(P)-dependent oxidoreductase [Actinomadura xylanilytica]